MGDMLNLDIKNWMMVPDKNEFLKKWDGNLEKFRGQYVFILFWSSSNASSIEMLKNLDRLRSKQLHDKNDFVIITVHTPQFSFEKNPENTRHVLDRHRIDIAVMDDPKGENWVMFGNNKLPKLVVFDKKTDIIFEYSGYISNEIVLDALQNKLSNMPIPNTYELFVGSLHDNSIGSILSCSVSGCDEFKDRGGHKQNFVYPDGMWRQQSEYLEFIGKKGYFSVPFNASHVNIVAQGEGHAEVLMEKRPIDKNIAGEDVTLIDGRSVININNAGMYNIFKSKHVQKSELTILPFHGLKLYSVILN